MPERTLYTLTWSTEHNAYELTLNGQLSQSFGAADEPVWFAWLATHPTFLFQGRAGSLRAYKESRSRGGDYWYAYHFTDRHLRKHYLGRNAALSFARLEEVAGMLQTIVPQPVHREHHSPTMQSNGSTVLPFLHSSFQVPLLPGTLVDRPRLLQQLDAAFLHPLTLLSASAGCGKTTLLSAWAARHLQQVAWLSLESLDNDQRRFWVSVILALRACQPDVGEAALALLQSSQPTTAVAILTALLNELTALPKAMVLILDDYHVIEEEALHEALFFVLEHLPTNLHLILSTRVDPAFPLAGFRARGQMTEIRAADLRFTATETTTFLTEAMGLPLSQQQSGILEERTEGWIAGLQLTALSLQKQDDPAAFLHQLKGSHRFLLDYVQEEILQSQSQRMQRFLLHTAILTRMNAALCEAVMGEPTAQALLEEAERSNLFLVPLDEERRWYRLHALFREALLTRLRTSQPEQVPLLQRRAATWYATQGFLHEAIAHALEAKDAPYAADLIERVIVPQSWRNEFPTLRRWLEHLPRAVLQERPWLSLTLASAITSTSPLGPGLLELVKEPLELAERGYRTCGDQAGVGGVLTLRAIVLVYQGAFAQAHTLVRQALVLLPESEEQWRMACLTLVGMEAAFAGRPDQARQLLLQSQELALATTSYIGKLGNTVLLGDVCLSRGELRQAARYLHQALTTLDEQPGLTRLQITRAMGTSEAPYYEQMACYGLAALSYEWNDLQAARQYFQATRPEPFHPLLLVLTPGLLFQVRLLLACGEAHTAEVRLEELVVQERRPEILREIHLCQAYLAFRRGELAKVEQWAATSPQAAELPALSKREAEALLLARFHLAKGQPDHALDLLAPWKQEARRAQRLHSELQILALEVLANEAKGARVQACDRLLQVLRLAQPENYQRLFLDEGPAMAALLQILVAERHEKELTRYMRALLHAFSQVQTGQERSPSSRAFLADGSVLFMEPLTTRELEVLRFLMEGASNQEIADQLVIALATVKKHVSNVLSKLGARNRVEAIAQARSQHLFE